MRFRAAEIELSSFGNGTVPWKECIISRVRLKDSLLQLYSDRYLTLLLPGSLKFLLLQFTVLNVLEG